MGGSRDEGRAVSYPPEMNATLIISPRATVHHDGVTKARPHLYLASPAGTVVKIGYAVEVAWSELLLGQTDPRDAVGK